MANPKNLFVPIGNIPGLPGPNIPGNNPLGNIPGLNMPGVWGSEDIEKLKKDRVQTFRKNKESNDLLKKMQEMGIKRFREMFGQSMVEQLKEIAEEERKQFVLKEKIRLQGKLKGDYPMCEKCVNWHGCQPGDVPCPYDNDRYEKSIVFDTNELSQNPFPVEVCENFKWVREENTK